MRMDTTHPQALYASTTLNGDEIHCVEADEDAGWVKVHRPIVDNPDRFIKLYGKVRIAVDKEAYAKGGK